MLKGIKSFIKKYFMNDEKVFRARLFYELRALQFSMMQKKHQNMTYQEIEAYISRQYEKMFGRPLDWDNPKSYNEKIHVSKLYMPSPLKTRLADKVQVREWVRDKLGEQYLIPLLGVYDSFDEIDFDALPEKFVVKCSHDSGSYTLVKDTSRINRKLLKRKYDIFMKRNFAYMFFEMHYKDIKPRIVIERYVDNAAVNDYRFYCFNGRPYYCAVDFYDGTHSRNARNIYGMNWELQPFTLGYGNSPENTPCPQKFELMKDIAAKLCEGFGHVRVDLYSADENIYFGEMTFAHANGLQKFTPDEWDYRLGELWPFDSNVRRKVLASHSKP